MGMVIQGKNLYSESQRGKTNFAMVELGLLPTHEHELQVFELDMGEGFSENIGPVVIGVNFDNPNCSIEDLISEVVVLD